MTQPLTVRVWLSDDPGFDFPERATDLDARTAPVGVCISGGGTRSMCAGMGQLRALHALGLLGRARYLSCVSGGSWLSTPFVFYADGLSDDETFLGPVTRPADITLAALRAPLPEACVGSAATRELNPVAFQKLKEGAPMHLLWSETVGECYFRPWALYAPERPASFTLDAASRDDIVRRNPALSDHPFHVARPGRPYLIVNGSVVGVGRLLPLAELTPSPFEVTPLYGGSPFGAEVLFRAADRRWESHWIGGGIVESFGLGSGALARIDNDPKHLAAQAPERPYRLCDASGISSAFLAGVAEKLPGGLSNLNPTLPIQSLAQTSAPAEPFSMGDGGVLENYGLLALLRRGVPRAVVFINTSVALNLDYDPSARTPTESDLDAYLPPLFGFNVDQPGVSTRANRVFRPKDFIDVVRSLQAARRAGGPVVARTRHDVQANTWWGIKGGWSVDVVWVYLEQSPLFEEAIADSEVHGELARRSLPLKALQGTFAQFPHYSTAFHNGTDLVKLLPEQVRLLADLTCWTVLEARALIEPLFAP